MGWIGEKTRQDGDEGGEGGGGGDEELPQHTKSEEGIPLYVVSVCEEERETGIVNERWRQMGKGHVSNYNNLDPFDHSLKPRDMAQWVRDVRKAEILSAPSFQVTPMLMPKPGQYLSFVETYTPLSLSSLSLFPSHSLPPSQQRQQPPRSNPNRQRLFLSQLSVHLTPFPSIPSIPSIPFLSIHSFSSFRLID